MSEPLIGIRRISPDDYWYVSWSDRAPILRLGRERKFEPGEPAMAECVKPPIINSFSSLAFHLCDYVQGEHFSPHPECMCGIYAFSWGKMQSYERPKSMRELYTLAVLGWGVTLIGDSGSVWRSQYAQPLAIVRYPPTEDKKIPLSDMSVYMEPLQDFYIDYMRDLRDASAWVREVSQRYHIPVVAEEAFEAWASKYGQLNILEGEELDEGAERAAPGDYSDEKAWYT